MKFVFSPPSGTDFITALQNLTQWPNAFAGFNEWLFEFENVTLLPGASSTTPYPFPVIATSGVLELFNQYAKQVSFAPSPIAPQYCSSPGNAVTDSQNVITNLQSQGVLVDNINMDSPCVAGINDCGLTLTEAITATTTYATAMLAANPNTVIGHQEPYPFFTVANFQQMIDGAVAGGWGSFIDIDINFHEIFGWFDSLQSQFYNDINAIKTYADSRGVTMGIIYHGYPQYLMSNQDWYNKMIRNALLVIHNLQNMNNTRVVFQEYTLDVNNKKMTPTLIPETTPYTFTWGFNQLKQALLTGGVTT